jgi:NADPH:quinone reductase
MILEAGRTEGLTHPPCGWNVGRSEPPQSWILCPLVQMKPLLVPCIRISDPGGPEVLVESSIQIPPPPFGHVRVRVSNSGVNRADLLQRRGRYPVPAGAPVDVPGMEFSGVVEAVGEGCFLRRPGDAVMGIVAGGGYAAALNVPERETVRIPTGVGPREAGAIPEVFTTAWDALERLAGLQSGETVLIHAVGSGVGTAAVQLARAMGAARIWGTSRTHEKVKRAIPLGLSEGWAVKDANSTWARELLDRTEGRGVDVILDLVGAPYVEGNQEALASQARWVVVGVSGGADGKLDLRHLMARRAKIIGTVLRARSPEERADLARDFERRIVPLFELGRLQPVLDAVLPWPLAAQAHRRMEANETFGKILLDWNGTTLLPG